MQDTLYCPICGDKMRSKKEQAYVQLLNKDSNFIERTCTGLNHCIQLVIDLSSKEIDFMKISLSRDFSRFVLIDIVNNKSNIICLKKNEKQSFEVPRAMIPDFPDLKELKRIIGLYITFS